MYIILPLLYRFPLTNLKQCNQEPDSEEANYQTQTKRTLISCTTTTLMLKLQGKTYLHLDTPSRLLISLYSLFRPEGTRTRAARSNSQINYAVDED